MSGPKAAYESAADGGEIPAPATKGTSPALEEPVPETTMQNTPVQNTPNANAPNAHAPVEINVIVAP